MTRERIGGAVVATVCLAAALHAAQDVPEFEFVSVRRSLTPPSTPAGIPAARGEFSVLANGRLEVRNETLANLTAVAFGFDGGPSRGVVQATADWMLQDGFDITASAGQEWTTPPPGTVIPVELRSMLRALLEDRFSMETRIATKQVSVTALRVAKPEKLGPYLRLSTGECGKPTANSSLEGATGTRRCPLTITQIEIYADAVTMPDVAHILSQHWLFSGRRVFVDQTGLTGLYDFSFSTNRRRATTLEGMVEEQLGLKLQPTRIPLPSLIIERASKPQPD